MNKIIEKENTKIENLIYEINGKQVMLDSYLEKLYRTDTKRVNEAVKRNIEKFPERFSWKLSKEEVKDFLVANCDQKIETRGGRFANPRVFTEQGIAMLATILKTEIAVQVTIKIMDTFVQMRKYINNKVVEQIYINKLVIKDHERINVLEETFSKLEEKTKCNSIFFEGQIYDAYSLLIDILNTSNKEIMIIDNYAGKELLDILKNIDKNIIIISKNISDELKKKYLSQYQNISFIHNNCFHDRFIIIDKQILYHCGSSFKDLGKKCFAINKIENIKILNNLLNEIKNGFNK